MHKPTYEGAVNHSKYCSDRSSFKKLVYIAIIITIVSLSLGFNSGVGIAVCFTSKYEYDKSLTYLVMLERFYESIVRQVVDRGRASIDDLIIILLLIR